jgi:uncharacterized membrane protein
MQMGLRIAGHPVHPALVHFPVALWPASLLWDVVGLWGGGAIWWQLSLWCLTLGLGVALLAIVSGFLDYAALPRDHPALGTGNAHLLVMTGATILFLVSLLIRAQSTAAHAAVPTLALVCSVLGTVLLVIGGWLGGTLVYRHGVGRSAD